MPIYNAAGQFVSDTAAHPSNVYLNDEAHQVPNITADEFRSIAFVIRQEGVTDEPDEYRFIGNVIHNEAHARGKSMRDVAMSGFSSVSPKTPLPDADNKPHSGLARAALLEILTGAPDPTGGARLWDGTDFLAWGLHSPAGNAHAKFRQYKHIMIPKAVYDEYLANTLKQHPSGHAKYGGIPFPVPAPVFTDPKNIVNGNFDFNTGAQVSQKLEAAATKGLTIFWRIV